MNRAQLEHVIRASATIADDDEIVVVGSQSILGQFPQAPCDLVVSKLVAGREKALAFARAAARHGLIVERVLRGRLSDTELVEPLRHAVSLRITRAFVEHG